MVYNFRERSPKNYKELATVALPRAQRTKAADPDALYRVEVLERDDERVKVHWIGYSNDKDEWIPADELTTLDKSCQECGSDGALHLEHYSPFNFHEELAYRIKASLTAGTREDVDVKIELPFDPLIYFGGLQRQGRFVRRWGGNDIYEIERYSQLSPLLGKQWYFRILNEQMNFCYINLDTVSYYLRKRRNLVEYSTGGCKLEHKGGFVLVFKFVRMDGVSRHLPAVLNAE